MKLNRTSQIPEKIPGGGQWRDINQSRETKSATEMNTSSNVENNAPREQSEKSPPRVKDPEYLSEFAELPADFSCWGLNE